MNQSTGWGIVAGVSAILALSFLYLELLAFFAMSVVIFLFCLYQTKQARDEEGEENE